MQNNAKTYIIHSNTMPKTVQGQAKTMRTQCNKCKPMQSEAKTIKQQCRPCKSNANATQNQCNAVQISGKNANAMHETLPK